MEIDDFFSCGILFFLGYVKRKISKDPSYMPNSLIRAFNAAILSLEKLQLNQHGMGAAFDGSEEKHTGGYIVVLKKSSNGMEIVKIHDVIHKVDISIPNVLAIFYVQILLDKHLENRLSIYTAVEILNACFETPKFVALGERWPEARDIYIEKFYTNKIHFPSGEMKRKYTEYLSKITKDTPWEDYPQELRAAMAQYILGDIIAAANTMVFSTTYDHTVEKAFVFKTINRLVMNLSKQYLPPKFK
jgi:hypothetical protein